MTIKKHFYGKDKKEAQDKCSEHLDTLTGYQLQNIISICVFDFVTPAKCRCHCEYPKQTSGKNKSKIFEMMQGDKSGYVFFCPGCNTSHTLMSLAEEDNIVRGDNVCHYKIEDSEIEFFNDCTHSLKGQTVIIDVVSKLSVNIKA